MLSPERIAAAHDSVRARLMALRDPAGHWVGELASSALSTATAISALSLMRRANGMDARVPTPREPLGDAKSERGECERGECDSRGSSIQIDAILERSLCWLMRQQRPDGGFGDTDRSHSNIATTLLTIAACRLADRETQFANQLEKAESYVAGQGGWDGLRRRYGRDRTFAVPILTNCALAGRATWSQIAALPFELACLPQSFYRFVRLPVVSYAIPALVAIGQARHYFRPTWFLPLRWLRSACVAPSLRVLERMQPASGGYLEATPLTSFVVMSLAAMGRADHPVAQRGLAFLLDSMRPDGSWPIDTNLATWITSLAVNALAVAGEPVSDLECWDWLLGCQHRVRHPFTGANPGGWGWTDLSGAVPDADDTPGALLALAARRDASRDGDDPRPLPVDAKSIAAVGAGLEWLLGLQNRDGGWPTFCRGWGKLPFDRSGADLTAHALRSFRAWHQEIESGQFHAQGVTPFRVARVAGRAFDYLRRVQRDDGVWIPLWFGNQDEPDEENPVYGTSKVLMAYADWGRLGDPPAIRARDWLVTVQHADGAWGTSASGTEGGTSIEETAIALDALIAARAAESSPTGNADTATRVTRSVQLGMEWLVQRIEDGRVEASPIGFYFAKLWYYEAAYPLVFALSALGRYRKLTEFG